MPAESGGPLRQPLGAGVLAGAGRDPARWKPKQGLPLTQPVQLYSSKGVLRVTVVAKRRTIEVSGSPLKAQTFGDQLIGPTLHVRPGDTIGVTFRNATSEDTNIHYHGLHVSPLGRSDNVFRVFAPGHTVRSVVRVPRDHAVGTFWYHAHYHPVAMAQVMGGMSGLLLVDGLARRLPRALRGITQRQLAIREVQTRGDSIVMNEAEINPSKPMTRLVNGLLKPRMRLRSGETQLWRLANIGPNIYYDLQLEGHSFRVLAEDGYPVWKVWKANRLLLPPGKRYDVLVQGGKPGSYWFKTLKYDEGFQDLPTVDLARVDVTGPAAKPTAKLPTSMASRAEDLTNAKVDRRRTFVFSTKLVPPFAALINGRQFDPSAMPIAPVLGSVEEWTLKNPSIEDHPFHMHVDHFQVMKVNGKPYKANGLQDIVKIPRKGGSVVIRMRFSTFTGWFVFHCHTLAHEDAGMMRTVEVVRKGQKPTPPPEATAMRMAQDAGA